MILRELGILDTAHSPRLPLATLRIPCGTGFPSPADDYLEEKLDLNKYLIKHPAATYYARAEGDSMVGAGIFPNDILVIDKAIEEVKDRIIIAWLNGEFTVKRYHVDNRLGKVYLVPENPKFFPHEITPEMDFMIWGVVTYSIHKL
ncbi:MAG: translesion error-prone DNA polymerase V autoproteolytic subunit [Deltaproteobacteria bacterium]